ncbi:OmpH family outer membrane protein [Candidatus Parabeggiatoa sp. HSG14]|uniref:OmpH family outer membrane protein n=1 Tax=Candidatus Parabeggiatoa sp. HSG14 TaxID=3055593 RepID=UPI0025A92981|nr:OmpH family outer membrane protein [Thiotrichales bacterium HSG14]
MKKCYFYLIVALFCSVLSSQVAAELKIGFVNAIKVMDKAPQVQRANKSLEQKFAPKQQALVSARQKIRKLEERFSRNAAIMSDAETLELSRKIRDKRRDLERQQEEFREDYNIRRNKELNKIQKVIIEVIQDLAKKESYDFILSEGVVWASKRVDITDRVLRLLRQRKSRNYR